MIHETVQTFLLAVLTGLVYAGIRVGAFTSSTKESSTDLEKGLLRGIPCEDLRNFEITVVPDS